MVAVVIVAGLLAFGVYSYQQMDLRWSVIKTASSKIEKVFHDFSITFPSTSDIVTLVQITLGIVVLGTVIAAIISVPVAYIAASNTTPVRWLRFVGRAIGVVTRAVPDVVIAIALSLMFALGSPIPGIIAIGIHSIGMISKLFADAIEQIDEGPRLAIRAAGGSPAQEFWSGVFPQVLPSWIATTLHRFDINLRGSVILGYAGVGGLGIRMKNEFEHFRYGAGIGVAIIVFILCVVAEIVSSTIRRSLLGIQPTRRGLGERIVYRFSPQRAKRNVAQGRANASADSTVDTVQSALKRPWTADRIRNTSWIVGALVFIVVCVFFAHIDVSQVLWEYAWPTLQSFWPPSNGAYGSGFLGISPEFWTALLVTMEIAFAAALVTVVFALVVGPLAARNVAPNQTVRGGFRVMLVLIRGVPELVLAIFLIAVTGLGNQPGLVALAFGGIGLLGKLIADSFEEVPSGPERALRAAGASRLQVYAGATLPQGFPSLIGNSLYLVDTNLRAASILGIVGAGGVGFYLENASSTLMQHGQVTTLVLMVFFVVLAVEAIATYLRWVFKER